MPRTAPLALVLALAWAPRAVAQERPLEEVVSVATAGGCLSTESLVPHLRVWLRGGAVEARLSVVVEEEGEGASFVVLRDGEASAARRFDRLPSSCPDRRAAVALAIALALDAAVLDALAAPSRDDEGGENEEGENGGVREHEDEDGAAQPSSAPVVRVELALAGIVAIEVLPEVAGGGEVAVRVVFDDTVELGAGAWVTSVSGGSLGPGHVDAQLAAGRLDLCVRRAVDVVTLRGCAAGAAGAAFGTGHDVPGARSATVPFAGALGRAGIAVGVTDWLAIEAAVDGWLAVLRPRFDLAGEGGEASASLDLPVGGVLLSAGLALRF